MIRLWQRRKKIRKIKKIKKKIKRRIRKMMRKIRNLRIRWLLSIMRIILTWPNYVRDVYIFSKKRNRRVSREHQCIS